MILFDKRLPRGFMEFFNLVGEWINGRGVAHVHRPGQIGGSSMTQMYFRQIISGTKDNTARVRVIPTILLRECSPNNATPAASNASVAAPRKNAGPDK